MPEAGELSFSEKLGTTLDVLDYSNITTSKILNVDPSYISRMRHGTRIPKPGSEMMDLVCVKLGACLWEKNLTEKINDSMRVNPHELKTRKGFLEAYKRWMSTSNQKNGLTVALGIVNAIHDYAELFCARDESSLDLSRIIDGVRPSSKKRVYFGREGLRAAVLRLFCAAVTNPKYELEIYSDQDLLWFTEDAEFMHLLQSLAAGFLQAGAKIRTVHFLSRDDAEIVDGFRVWMPLYFLGEVESYYRLEEQGSLFSHTLMNFRGYAAVAGTCVRGSESDGMYHYAVSKPERDRYGREFDALADSAQPLISTFDERSKTDRLEHCSGEDVAVVISSLPVEALSEEDLIRMLKRASVDQCTIDDVCARYHRARERFERLIRKNNVSFLHYAYEKNAPRLFADDHIFSLVSGLEYQEGEWKQHFQKTVDYFAGYGVPLKVTTDELTKHTNIVAFSDCVLVSMSNLSQKTFVFSQPSMVEAMNQLLERLSQVG